MAHARSPRGFSSLNGNMGKILIFLASFLILLILLLLWREGSVNWSDIGFVAGGLLFVVILSHFALRLGTKATQSGTFWLVVMGVILFVFIWLGASIRWESNCIGWNCKPIEVFSPEK